MSRYTMCDLCDTLFTNTCRPYNLSCMDVMCGDCADETLRMEHAQCGICNSAVKRDVKILNHDLLRANLEMSASDGADADAVGAFVVPEGDPDLDRLAAVSLEYAVKLKKKAAYEKRIAPWRLTAQEQMPAKIEAAIQQINAGKEAWLKALDDMVQNANAEIDAIEAGRAKERAERQQELEEAEAAERGAQAQLAAAKEALDAARDRAGQLRLSRNAAALKEADAQVDAAAAAVEAATDAAAAATGRVEACRAKPPVDDYLWISIDEEGMMKDIENMFTVVTDGPDEHETIVKRLPCAFRHHGCPNNVHITVRDVAQRVFTWFGEEDVRMRVMGETGEDQDPIELPAVMCLPKPGEILITYRVPVGMRLARVNVDVVVHDVVIGAWEGIPVDAMKPFAGTVCKPQVHIDSAECPYGVVQAIVNDCFTKVYRLTHCGSIMQGDIDADGVVTPRIWPMIPSLLTSPTDITWSHAGSLLVLMEEGRRIQEVLLPVGDEKCGTLGKQWNVAGTVSSISAWGDVICAAVKSVKDAALWVFDFAHPDVPPRRVLIENVASVSTVRMMSEGTMAVVYALLTDNTWSLMVCDIATGRILESGIAPPVELTRMDVSEDGVIVAFDNTNQEIITLRDAAPKRFPMTRVENVQCRGDTVSVFLTKHGDLVKENILSIVNIAPA